tara:strand:- start:33161 stop:33871 length:711 start_codon:yes stop_codon:yes gene_type:complete
MSYVLLGGIALLAVLAAYQFLRGIDRRLLMRSLRWVIVGIAGLGAVALILLRRIDLALFLAAGAISVFRSGRLGPFSFEGPPEGNVSKVRSRYFAMALDHDTGAVAGRVLAGQFSGADLIDLGEAETRSLIDEVQDDPDSLHLLESWLDANRAGWREYFAETAEERQDHDAAAASDPRAHAYEVLGLKPGASDDEIKAAHRELMKAVHPDHGGSSYLAARINQARDELLGSDRAKG